MVTRPRDSVFVGFYERRCLKNEGCGLLLAVILIINPTKNYEPDSTLTSSLVRHITIEYIT